MPDPKQKLSTPEKQVFGADAERHPITGYVIEKGYGALSPRAQAYDVHLPLIAKLEGQAAAAAMRQRLIDSEKPALVK
jgi:hypothetical protein